MKVYKWSEFLKENLQLARKVLKDNSKSENDTIFSSIKDIVGNNTAYLGLFTKYYYEQEVSIDDLKELITFLRDNSSRLPKNALSYDSYEKLSDDINDIKRDVNIKAVYNKLTASQKEFTDLKSDDFKNLAYEISIIPNKGFFAKISKAKGFKELIGLMQDYIEKNKMGASYDSLIKIVDSTENTKVVFDDNQIVIVEVLNYTACKSLGSTNWCIVNNESNWNSYTDGRKQYIVWNFDYNVGQANYMIGVTVGYEDEIYACHDYNDKNILDFLPKFILEIKKYFKGPSEADLTEMQIEKEKRRAEERAVQEERRRNRIARLKADNQRLKDNGQWEESYYQAMKDFLIEENLFDEEDDDESMIFYQPNSYYGARTFEYGDYEFAICKNDEANILTLNIIREWEDSYFPLDTLINYIDEDRYADSYIDEEGIRDDWEYLGIEADEDGDMDEDSFEEYIEKEKENIKSNIIDHIEEYVGKNEDDIRNVVSQFLYPNYKYDIAKDYISKGYRGEVIASYDSSEYEVYYNNVWYYIYRL